MGIYWFDSFDCDPFYYTQGRQDRSAHHRFFSVIIGVLHFVKALPE